MGTALITPSIQAAAHLVKSTAISHAAPKDLRVWLSDHANDPIVAIDVRREPVAAGIQKFFNLVSLGGLERAKKEEGYDNIYHLFLVIRFRSGESLRLEKNQRVEARKYNVAPTPPVESQPVPLMGRHLTLPMLISAAEKLVGAGPLYEYNSSGHNCQHFAASILRASGLLTPSLEKWILQDAEALMRHIPGVAQRFAKSLTDFAHKADILVRGQGPKRPPRQGNSLEWLREMRRPPMGRGLFSDYQRINEDRGITDPRADPRNGIIMPAPYIAPTFGPPPLRRSEKAPPRALSSIHRR